MKSINEKINIFIDEFSEKYGEFSGISPQEVKSKCKSVISYYKKRSDVNPLLRLELAWFDGQDKGINRYDVYGDKDYYSEVFACWYIYSRDYIKRLIKFRDTNPDLFSKLGFGDVNSIIDVGNGLGITTLTLAREFPNARVYGTNLKDTDQWKFCTRTNDDEYTLIDDYSSIGSIDMVFASEYFEHIDNCLEHLEDMVSKLDPKIFVVANSFNTRGIGHLYLYNNYGIKYPQEKMSKMFTQKMKELGYEKAKVGFWNNTPTVFVKSNNKNQNICGI